MAGLQTDAAVFAGTAESKKDEFEYEKQHAHSQVAVSSTQESELDGIHDGLEFPTDEERDTLRRVPDSIPWPTYLIAIVEMAERFSFYGCSVVFTNYIQQPLPSYSRTGAGGDNGQSGALGLGQQSSTGLTTFYQFWCYVVPLFGGFVADAYLGRYKTISWSVLIAFIGHILLVISAVPGVIEHSSAVGAFAVALVVMGIGTGGFKANISPLVAEQYKRTKLFIGTTKKGERVIVDPSLTVARIYMYFYFFINVGALVGQISMVYCEKYVGFWLAFALPTFVFLLCPIVLWIGRNRYARSPPTGSVLAAALRLFAFAARGRWSVNPVRMWNNFNTSDFWDSAKPSNVPAEKRPAWMKWDDQWVDEVGRGFKACAVFIWYPLYWLAYSQLNNNLTSQAATMSTHNLPNDVLSNLDPFALLILIPVCDLFLYPLIRRLGFNLTQLKKIAFGFATGAAAMIWAAVVQHYIYKTSPCGYEAGSCAPLADGTLQVSPLNVWIQTGAYVLVAMSEIFASITGLEYAFTKAPKNMRSLVTAVFLFTNAISSAIAEALVPLTTDPLLVWNYGVVAVIAAVGGTLFWLSVRNLDKKEDELNNLAEGHYGDAVVPADREKQ